MLSETSKVSAKFVFTYSFQFSHHVNLSKSLFWAHAGAFVAGLDAGHAYNTFPLMDGRLIPEEYWAVEGWRNAFESTAAVQLHHRALALSTLGGVAALWAASRSLQLPRPCRLLVNGMLAMAGLQAGTALWPIIGRQLWTFWLFLIVRCAHGSLTGVGRAPQYPVTGPQRGFRFSFAKPPLYLL